jgi:hypothetical protein
MSNLKYIPTKKLNDILNSHHTTGIDGADYGPVKEELQAILWERLNRENERISRAYFDSLEAYADTLEIA